MGAQGEDAINPLLNHHAYPPLAPRPPACSWGADYNELATHHDHELVAPFCDPEYHPVTPDGEPYQIFKVCA